jgi:hypothetical protein
MCVIVCSAYILMWFEPHDCVLQESCILRVFEPSIAVCFTLVFYRSFYRNFLREQIKLVYYTQSSHYTVCQI